jgi:uncharacterized membrane protein YdjX (TVP38/TMEM64 family)
MDLKKYRHEAEFLAFILIIVLFCYSGKCLHLSTEGLQRSLAPFPLYLSAGLYILLYVVISFFFFFSKDIFWLSAALLFGAGLSTVLISLAETINAFILFHLSRRLGRGYVEKKVSVKFVRLDERLARINFFWLFLFRAAPLIPYRFLDLAAGLTKISFRKYLAAVILGTPLKMFWIQYILAGVGKSILDNPAVVVGYFLENRAFFQFSLIYLALVILVAIRLRKV